MSINWLGNVRIIRRMDRKIVGHLANFPKSIFTRDIYKVQGYGHGSQGQIGYYQKNARFSPFLGSEEKSSENWWLPKVHVFPPP